MNEEKKENRRENKEINTTGDSTENTHANSTVNSAEDSENYLLAEAGGYYAFPLNQVNTVTRAEKITKIPGSQDFIRGLMNYRNEIYVMYSLEKLFGTGDNTDGDHMAVMLEGKDNRHSGILVMKVNGIAEIFHSEIKPVDIGGRITGIFSRDTEVMDNESNKYKKVKITYKIFDAAGLI